MWRKGVRENEKENEDEREEVERMIVGSNECNETTPLDSDTTLHI